MRFRPLFACENPLNFAGLATIYLGWLYFLNPILEPNRDVKCRDTRVQGRLVTWEAPLSKLFIRP